MENYPELVIRLQRWDSESYDAELRYSQPDSDDEKDLTQDRPIRARFDFPGLRELADDGEAYGRTLAESLFGGPIGQALVAIERIAQQNGTPLRVRLSIPGGAWELHSLLWEALRDPRTDDPLLTTENILFSRYLNSDDWRRVQRRSKSSLRALIVIADPRRVERYAPGGRALSPLDVAGELQRAQQSLGSMPTTALAARGSATLRALLSNLRDGCDLLYLVCHGALLGAEPLLWLENEAGEVAVVPGRELVTRVRELEQVPRLVVLASCQSAGSGTEARTEDGGALAALGPRLAAAGVPAVLAMQGNVTARTVEQFMPIFFRELQRDGQIDRALAVARGAVRERPDYWMPVLFMRLKSGQLWCRAGFGDEGFRSWPALNDPIGEATCTEILSPRLARPRFGQRREQARPGVASLGLPSAVGSPEELPWVAQLRTLHEARGVPTRMRVDQRHAELFANCGGRLPGYGDGIALAEPAPAASGQNYAPDLTESCRGPRVLRFPTFGRALPGGALIRDLRQAGSELREMTWATGA